MTGGVSQLFYLNCKKKENLLRRKAFCASIVIASASSRIINLNPDLKIVLVLANVKTCPRTMPIPLSSDAFSSNTFNKETYSRNLLKICMFYNIFLP